MNLKKYYEFIDNNDNIVKNLTDRIEEEFGNQSMLNFLYDHPLYEKIISIGTPAISHLLKKINETNSMFWFEALRKITGAEPDKDIIKSKDIRESWNKWGEENGY